MQKTDFAPHWLYPGRTWYFALVAGIWVSHPEGVDVGQMTLPLICLMVADRHRCDAHTLCQSVTFGSQKITSMEELSLLLISFSPQEIRPTTSNRQHIRTDSGGGGTNLQLRVRVCGSWSQYLSAVV